MIRTMRHYEESAFIAAPPERVFNFADDHGRLSAHMTRPSWMMGGGRVTVSTNSGGEKRAGSRIKLEGTAFGMRVSVEETVTLYDPPRRKEWETVGEPKLIVIGRYRMGLTASAADEGTKLTVFIDYELPKGPLAQIMGKLLGNAYARWCVRQILKDGRKYFDTNK